MQILKFVIAAAATVGISVSAAAQEGPLVSTEWTEKNLNNPKVRIVEVSVEPASSSAGTSPARRTSLGTPILWTP
jgi:thiosulfate/3-mercaptopyruvate sulfurtransferase